MTFENVISSLPVKAQAQALHLLMKKGFFNLDEVELEQAELEALLEVSISYSMPAFKMMWEKLAEADEEELEASVSHSHHTRTRAERRASKRKYAGRDRSHGKRSHWEYKMYSSGRNNDCACSAKERRMQSYANELLNDPDPVEQGLWVPFDEASEKQEAIRWADYHLAMAVKEIQQLQAEYNELQAELQLYERIRQNAQQMLDEAGVISIDADFIYMK